MVPPKPSQRQLPLIPMTLLNLITWAAGIACLFFVFTNGIPLIQAGIISELGSKSRYVQTMRISVAVFLAVLLLIRWKSEDLFEDLWVVRAIRNFLNQPLDMITTLFFMVYSFALILVGFIRHAALETRAFDLGIFSQAVWNTLQGDFLYSSIKGGICLLGDHFSPILALIAPLFSLWPDPRMLLILQVFAAASCIFLIAQIAREKTGNHYVAVLFSLAYCFFLPTRNALHEDFHPEVLVDPFILLCFIFLEKNRISWFLMSLAVVIAGKENMLMVAFIFGFYAWMFKKMRSLGTVLMLVSVVIFVMEVRWAIPKISGQPYLYQGFYQHLLKGSPLDWLGAVFNGDSIEYILKVFSPLLFLSFFHGPTLILTLPVLAQNILSNNDVFRSFAYHYTTGLTPFVFISAIYGWDVLVRRFSWFSGRQVLFGCLLLFVSLMRSGPSEYYYFWQSWIHRSPHRDMIREKLNSIPEKAVVVTHNNFIPQLSERKYVYQFDYNPTVTKTEMAVRHNADFVIFDREFWERGTLAPGQTLLNLQAAGYEIYFQKNGFYILQHRDSQVR